MADRTQPAANEAEYANFMPAGVRRQAERANQMAGEYAASITEPTAEPVVEPVVEPATTVVEPVTPPAAPVVDWEQRYRTLQGKYDREVPTLRNDLNTLRSQLETVQARQPEPAAPAETAKPVVPAADVETFGEDLIAGARRWARAEVATELDEMRAQLATVTKTTDTIKQDSAQAQAQSRHLHTMAQLDADPVVGKNWRAINDDNNFIAWCDQVDPFTGQQRIGLLRDAFGRGEVTRTAAFFKAYVQEHTATQPAPVQQPTPETTGRPNLADFASPGRGTAPAPGGAPTDKRLWTQTEIAAFYREKTKPHGAYKDRAADAARVEADIIAAASEGRIR